MSEKFENIELDEATENIDEIIEAQEQDEPNSEDIPQDFQEQVNQLPMWQHILLTVLFLFGMAAVIVVIDFIVEFGAELIKRIF